MKSKSRLFLNLIVAAVFAVIAVVGFFSVFTVAEIGMAFSLGANGERYEADVRAELEKYRGKNMLFLDTEDVAADLAAYPYLEVTRLEKVYPNTLVAEFSERREMFSFESGGKSYILDGNGFVLSEGPSENGKPIRLTAKTFSVTEEPASKNLRAVVGSELPVFRAEPGHLLEVDDGGILSLVYAMRELADYTDNVAEIEAKYGAIGGEILLDEVVFHMRTGVEVWVYDVFDDGLEKMRAAMAKYTEESDYKKSMKYITVKKVDGNIVAIWEPVVSDVSF